MTKARDAQTGILPGQEPDGVRIFLYKKRPASRSLFFWHFFDHFPARQMNSVDCSAMSNYNFNK